MENDFISREDALGTLSQQLSACSKYSVQVYTIERSKERISAIPASDAAPAIHGKWEAQHQESEEDGEVVWIFADERCSQCGESKPKPPASANFCPNCGAKMDNGNQKEATQNV